MTPTSRHLPAALALALAACGAPRVGEPTPGTITGPAATYETIASRVFALSCATQSCHTGSPPPNAPDSFDPERAYDVIVGQPSLQVPAIPLVDPGNPDHSYVILKLRGTAATAGGVATRMPLNAQPLSDDDLVAIESWIAAGAAHD